MLLWHLCDKSSIGNQTRTKLTQLCTRASCVERHKSFFVLVRTSIRWWMSKRLFSSV